MNEFSYKNLSIESIDSILRETHMDRIEQMRQEMQDFFMGTSWPTTLNQSLENKSTKIMEGNKLDITITDRDRSYGDSRVYRYLINKDSVLRFEQIPYPECCGIAIIKNFSANRDMSKVDFLDAIDGFIEDMKQNDRYSKVLFYTAKESVGDKMFSMINGITILDSFTNKRSGNTLVGFEIDLLDKESREGWHSLDLDDEESDEEETDGEHDEEEEEDNDPFGLSMITGSIRSVRPANNQSSVNPIYWSTPQYFNSDNSTGINRSSDNS